MTYLQIGWRQRSRKPYVAPSESELVRIEDAYYNYHRNSDDPTARVYAINKLALVGLTPSVSRDKLVETIEKLKERRGK